MRRAFEIVFRIGEVRFALRNLRFRIRHLVDLAGRGAGGKFLLHLRFRGVRSGDFAFEIRGVGLRRFEVGALARARIGELRELLDALFREDEPRADRRFLRRRVFELILKPRAAWPRR